MIHLNTTSRSLIAAISLIAMVGIGLSLTLPLLSLEMERMGVSAAASGVQTAAAGVAAIAIAPFVPQIAARLGVGRLLAFAIAGAVAVLIGFKVTSTYWAWLPLRFAFSVCLAMLFILSEFWISATAPAERRGFIMGVYGTVLSLGFAAGPTLLALVGTTGWAPYLSGAALFVLAALPLGLARGRWPDVPTSHQSASVMRYVKVAPLAAMAGFASGAIETGAIAMLPVLGLRLDLGAGAAALLVSAVALGNVATQMPIGWRSDRLDRRLMLLAIASLAMVLSGLIATLTVPGAWALPMALLVWGGFVGALYPIGLAHLAARFKVADLVGANAAFVVMFNVGILVGPPLAGAAVDASTQFGFPAAMALFAGLVVGAALLERRPVAAP